MLHETYSVHNRPYSTRAIKKHSRTLMEPWRARCVQGYVGVHLHSKITLPVLARVAHLSQSHFNRKFRASFGCTPSQYVRQMRIARAQNLMMMCRDPLSLIAAECGFADQPHFTRCFRKVVGEPPAMWRARREAAPPAPQSRNIDSSVAKESPLTG